MTDPFNDTHEMHTSGSIERDPNGIDPHKPGAAAGCGRNDLQTAPQCSAYSCEAA